MPPTQPEQQSPALAVAICNWRDLTHPEGGGSELYVENVARGLAARGARVTLLSSAVAGQPRDEDRGGVHYRRRGGRLTVYLHAAWALASRSVRPDVVLDVQNGMPFLSRLVTRRPVVTLVHHVHREQWPMVFGRRAATLGWWVESRLAPRLYRRSPYVVVSESTRDELALQRIDPARMTVAHNGSPQVPASRLPRSATPRVVVLGRLVPHKRIELALRAVAAIREQLPDLVLDVVGQGYWAPQLEAEARRLGLTDAVVFHGFVDDQTKSDLLAQAWVNAVPSIKEGWALSVVEAAQHCTPSIAFAAAGGLRESIVDGRTGLLVGGDAPAAEAAGEQAVEQTEFTAALAGLLVDADRREQLGRAAREHARSFTWERTVGQVSDVLTAASGGLPLPAQRDRRSPAA